jgi:hypothetical protein
MNPGPTEEGIKVAGSFVDALKREPLSLSLVVMNMCLLVFSWFILSSVAKQNETEFRLLYDDKARVETMLSNCIVPKRDGN